MEIVYEIREGLYRGKRGWWISGGEGEGSWATWKPTLADFERSLRGPIEDPSEDVTIGSPSLLRNDTTPEGKAIWDAVDKAASRAPEWVKKQLK